MSEHPITDDLDRDYGILVNANSVTDKYRNGLLRAEREIAALREAALKAVHTIGKALHGEGKDFRDLDHTYKLLIDLLPAEALSQGSGREHAPGCKSFEEPGCDCGAMTDEHMEGNGK